MMSSYISSMETNLNLPTDSEIQAVLSFTGQHASLYHQSDLDQANANPTYTAEIHSIHSSLASEDPAIQSASQLLPVSTTTNPLPSGDDGDYATLRDVLQEEISSSQVPLSLLSSVAKQPKVPISVRASFLDLLFMRLRLRATSQVQELHTMYLDQQRELTQERELALSSVSDQELRKATVCHFDEIEYRLMDRVEKSLKLLEQYITQNEDIINPMAIVPSDTNFARSYENPLTPESPVGGTGVAVTCSSNLQHRLIGSVTPVQSSLAWTIDTSPIMPMDICSTNAKPSSDATTNPPLANAEPNDTPSATHDMDKAQKPVTFKMPPKPRTACYDFPRKVLWAWLVNNQYDLCPTSTVTSDLATKSGLTITQVEKWFRNQRQNIRFETFRLIRNKPTLDGSKTPTPTITTATCPNTSHNSDSAHTKKKKHERRPMPYESEMNHLWKWLMRNDCNLYPSETVIGEISNKMDMSSERLVQWFRAQREGLKRKASPYLS
ncbi:uncharacterized protein LOC106175991 [Lingula anatina]|uniref:Uncharacterized protein LOC106175991 n=1 Tax=Lingula anatina TaxID=7574 RepID=A0A1S3JU88_LINAN|nr:uncharacterized protein LOC106175991 [Lingula anatina]|eukprot:XP_013413649.1 uncharacterized protein LOC106175991 [Lingula anatina]